MNVPEDRYICKYCWYCSCTEETKGNAICFLDIGDVVNVNDGVCDAFEYDPDFVRS